MMNTLPGDKPIEVLVVEDSLADAEMLDQVLRRTHPNCRVHFVHSGDAAVAFLRREGEYIHAPRPVLVILDLRIPARTGVEVLLDMKRDKHLRTIPVLIFTASDDPHSVTSLYGMSAACYVVKPVGLGELTEKIGAISDFWFKRVKLPTPN